MKNDEYSEIFQLLYWVTHIDRCYDMGAMIKNDQNKKLRGVSEHSIHFRGDLIFSIFETFEFEKFRHFIESYIQDDEFKHIDMGTVGKVRPSTNGYMKKLKKKTFISVEHDWRKCSRFFLKKLIWPHFCNKCISNPSCVVPSERCRHCLHNKIIR